MKKFIYKLSFFTIAYIILFIIASFTLKYFVDKYSNFKLKDSSNAVILGHSHTECDLDDSLIPHVKNLSQGGEAYFYTYRKLKNC